jgi:hypothetical protein
MTCQTNPNRGQCRLPVYLFAALFLSACNAAPGDPTVVIEPENPTTVDDIVARIATPASDSNADTLTYSYAWFRNGDSVSDVTGDTVSADLTERGEAWKVVVSASIGDVEGPPAEAETTIVNALPEAEVSIAPAMPLTGEALVASATSSDDDGDAVTLGWSWLADGTSTTFHSDTVPAGQTVRGQAWTVSVLPQDVFDLGKVATAAVTIDNVAPAIASVSLEPSPAFEDSEIEAVIAASDGDGDPVTLDFAWYVNDAIVKAGPDGTLDGADFDKHDEVRVTVTPNDGFVDGELAESVPLTIQNSVPSIEGVSLDPSTILEATLVSCVATGWSDADGDSDQSTVAWTVDGVVAGSGSTLDGTAFDRDDTIACSVTPYDGESTGMPRSSAAVTVDNTSPVLAAVSLSTDSPTETDTVSIVLGASSDDDGDSVTYIYQWYVSGVASGSSATLSHTHFAKHDTIQVLVTPTDGTTSGSAVWSEIATVANTPPSVTSLELSPSTLHTNDVAGVSCATADADGDTLTLSYTWNVDGTAAGSSATLDGATAFDRGQVVEVIVTPNDGEEDGAEASASATVANAAPSTPVVDITPSDPGDDDDLVCGIITASTDDDGDVVSYTFVWTVDDEAFTDAGTTTYPEDTVAAGDTSSREEWSCIVIASDGSDAANGAAEVTIGGFQGWPDHEFSLSESDTILIGPSAGDRAGWGARLVDDLDGDGTVEILVGARNCDFYGSDTGAAFLVMGATASTTSRLDLSTADYVFEGENYGDAVGGDVETVGDMDGDGLVEILISAYFNDDAGTRAGKAYLVQSTSLPGWSGSLSNADSTFVGEAAGDYAGWFLGGAGDLDGDGLGDLVIGAAYNCDGGTRNGKAYVFMGDTLVSPGDFHLADADYTIVGLETHDYLGADVAGIGDVDGDGLDDFAIGAAENDDVYSYTAYGSGKVYLWHGSSLGSTASLSPSAADARIQGTTGGDAMGRGLASGDIDGDDLSDLIVGAVVADAGGSNAGAVYLFTGDTLGGASYFIASDADARVYGDSANDQVGNEGCPAAAIDMDMDGLDDLVVNARADDAAGSDAGQVGLFLATTLLGSTVRMSDADWLFDGTDSGGLAGWYVDGGDIDGDGRPDLMISAVRGAANGTESGQVYLLYSP